MVSHNNFKTKEEIFFNAVPKKYRNCSLKNCDKISKTFIEFGLKWGKKPTSLFIFGGKGSGKTFFSFSLIREMFRNYPEGIWPRYYTSPSLDMKLLDAITTGSDKGDIDLICQEDLLFIDDFGRETKSERIKRQYFEIVNYRYSEELPTILTSNFNPLQIGEMLDPVIASRIEEWQVLEFTGPDLRPSIGIF